MPRRRRPRTAVITAIAGALACLAAPAAAQVAVDVGVHAGAACLNGGPACAGGFVGPVATVRWDDRFALRLRHLTVEVGDRISQTGPVVVSTREREGRLILGELLFEWLRRSKVRPVVGVSLGRRTFRSVTTCEPVSCAEVNASPGGPRVADGVITNRRATLGGIAGISLRAGERVTLQGLIAVHDPWQEHGETVEGMIVVSLAVWRSR